MQSAMRRSTKSRMLNWWNASAPHGKKSEESWPPCGDKGCEEVTRFMTMRCKRRRMEAAAVALDKAQLCEEKADYHEIWDQEDGQPSGDDGDKVDAAEAMDWESERWTDRHWDEWRQQQHRGQQQQQQGWSNLAEGTQQGVQSRIDHTIARGQLEQARAPPQEPLGDGGARKAEELRAQQARMEEQQRSGRLDELAVAIASCEAEVASSAARAAGRDENAANAAKQTAEAVRN